MGKFKVGDVCVVCNISNPYTKHYNGIEFTVIACYPEHRAYNTDIPHPDGEGTWDIGEEFMRLKKPPQEFTGESRIIELFNPNNKPITIEDIEKLEEVVV